MFTLHYKPQLSSLIQCVDSFDTALTHQASLQSMTESTLQKCGDKYFQSQTCGFLVAKF